MDQGILTPQEVEQVTQAMGLPKKANPLDLLTDAKNRPEIKAILGLLSILTAFVLSITWLFVKSDIAGCLALFGGFFGAGATLLGIQAVADAAIDKAAK